MKNLTRTISAASKTLEIIYWIIALFFLSTAILCIVSPGIVAEVGLDYSAHSQITVNGFSIRLTNADGSVNPSALTLFSCATVLNLSLGAMVFHNVHSIIKKASLDKDFVPFSNDITQMVKKIGIFYILIFFIDAFAAVIGQGIVDASEISVSVSNLMTGIVIICLSQVFTYGQKLQSDVDGLL